MTNCGLIKISNLNVIIKSVSCWTAVRAWVVDNENSDKRKRKREKEIKRGLCTSNIIIIIIIIE